MDTHRWHTATYCKTLQHTATHCIILQHTATRCNAADAHRRHTAKHCNAPQHTATHCNTLQHSRRSPIDQLEGAWIGSGAAVQQNSWCGVALASRIDKIIGFFCKRVLQKRRFSAKETYNLIDPTDRGHPMSEVITSVFRPQRKKEEWSCSLSWQHVDFWKNK